MLCKNCGNSIYQGATFCATCGHPVQMQAGPPQPQNYQPYHQPVVQQAASGGKFVIVAVSLAAIAVICAVAVAIVFLTRDPQGGAGGAAGGAASDDSNGRAEGGSGFAGARPITTSEEAAEIAMTSLGNDLSRRLESTPFGAFPMLFEALTDGVVSLSFDYSDRWTSGSFDVEIHINDARGEAMSLWNVNIEGFEFDLEWHMNRYSQAFRTSLLGDEFYGFTYATFREDFAPIAQALGMSAWEIDEIASLMEMLGDMMAMPDLGLDAFVQYEELVDRFVQGGALPLESTTIISGGQSVDATRAAFRFTDDDIVRFLRDFLRMMSQDTNLDPFAMIDPWMWDQVMRDFDSVVDEFARYVSGYMEIAMYIGPQNRLVRFNIIADMTADNSVFGMEFEADFGTSALAPWTFTILGFTEMPSWDDPTRINTDGFEFVAVWTHTESGGRHTNTIEVTTTTHDSWWDSWSEEWHEHYRIDSGRMISDWNSNTGDFVLRFEDDSPWSEPFEFSGYYSVDGRGGFTLGFAHDTGWESFNVEISTSLGTNFTPVREFTSIMDIPLSALLDLMFAF